MLLGSQKKNVDLLNLLWNDHSRALQPCNVLLKGDGHIKLADMGGVAEFAEGTCLESTKVRAN